LTVGKDYIFFDFFPFTGNEEKPTEKRALLGHTPRGLGLNGLVPNFCLVLFHFLSSETKHLKKQSKIFCFVSFCKFKKKSCKQSNIFRKKLIF